MADEWTYREEGNNNVVFTSINNRSILRLPKVPKVKKSKEDRHVYAGHDAINEEIEFLENVVYKILSGLRLTYRAERMAITKDFIRKLSTDMNKRRSLQNNGMDLDDTVTYALKMPNFCNAVVPHPVVHHPTYSTVLPADHHVADKPIISIELRPKTCYFPVFDEAPCEQLKDRCFFCLVQMYKELKHPGTKHTRYCPCDLYSGNLKRMKVALLELIACPQRYLSARINDTVVYSQGILNKKIPCNANGMRQKLATDIFKEVISPVYGNRDGNGLDVFLDAICKSLLSPIATSGGEKSSVGHWRKNNSQKRRCVGAHYEVTDSTYRDDDVKEIQNSSDTNILSFLDSISSMKEIPVALVESMHQKITDHAILHPCNRQNVSLSSPYNTKEWLRASGFDSFSNGFCSFDGVGRDHEKFADILRKYIVARGFNCCSIIITLQKANLSSSSDEPLDGSTVRLTDSAGNVYHSTLSILDLYKDPANQIQKYCKRERDVLYFLNNHFSNLKT